MDVNTNGIYFNRSKYNSRSNDNYDVHNHCNRCEWIDRFRRYHVTVNPLPAVDQINDVSYCNGDAAAAINFSGPINGTGFSWISSIDVGFGTNGNGNIGAFTATNNGVTPVTSTITVTPSANGCTGTPITFTITVYPTATVNSITNQTYCTGVVAPITNLSGPVSGTTFTWTNSNTAIGLAASGSGDIPSFSCDQCNNVTHHCNHYCNTIGKWMHRNTNHFYYYCLSNSDS